MYSFTLPVIKNYVGADCTVRNILYHLPYLVKNKRYQYAVNGYATPANAEKVGQALFAGNPLSAEISDTGTRTTQPEITKKTMKISFMAFPNCSFLNIM